MTRSIPTLTEASMGLSEANWTKLEKIATKKFSPELRVCVDEANLLFAMACCRHDGKWAAEIANLSKAVGRLEKVIAQSFEKPIKVPQVRARAKVLARWSNQKTIARLAHVSPVKFLRFALASVLDAGQCAVSELEERHQKRLQALAWLYWSASIAMVFRANGLKDSTAGTDKGGSGSPFVQFIVELQAMLPAECSRHRTVEAARKYIQAAKREFRGTTSESLYMGLKQLSGYRRPKPNFPTVLWLAKPNFAHLDKKYDIPPR